jgi:menaquinone-dependent protoporphyrinogen oxidase
MSAKTKITRRRFLALAGGTAGAAALACCGLTGLAVQQPAVEMVKSSCGEEDDVGNKILIAYASRCGSTGEVAQAISRVLCQAGAAVDVRQMKDVADVSAYRAVIVGSAAYRFSLLPEAVEFVKANRRPLSQVPLAYFVVCGTLQEDTPEKRQRAAAYLAPLREMVQPADEGLFAGAIDYGRVSFLEQLIVRMLGGKEGDWRDWDAIEAWAGRLPPAMSAA